MFDKDGNRITNLHITQDEGTGRSVQLTGDLADWMKVLNWNAEANKLYVGPPPRRCDLRHRGVPDLMPDGGATVTSDLSGWSGGHEGVARGRSFSGVGRDDGRRQDGRSRHASRSLRPGNDADDPGDITFMAVCIPWSGSRTGPAFETQRRKWEDHETYLECLGRMLSKASTKRLVVVSNFNQRARAKVCLSCLASALHGAVVSRLTVATAALGCGGRHAIDHIALGTNLHSGATEVIANMHEGRRLSDHFGVFADAFARRLDSGVRLRLGVRHRVRGIGTSRELKVVGCGISHGGSRHKPFLNQ